MTLSKSFAPAEDLGFLVYPKQLRSPILKVTELLSVAGATDDGVSLCNRQARWVALLAATAAASQWADYDDSLLMMLRGGRPLWMFERVKCSDCNY